MQPNQPHEREGNPLPPAWSLDVDHQLRHAHHFWHAAKRVPPPVRLIAVGKGLKGALFLVVGLVISKLLHAPDLQELLQRWIAWIHVDPGAAIIHRAIDAVTGVSHHTLEVMGFGSFLYATLYLVEGLGLWFGRRWAEWMTAVSTALLVPAEVSHLIHHPGIGIALILLVNLAVMAYLLRLVLAKSPAEAQAGPDQATRSARA
jgi:uncharacterized membrane protein (DUF2068 family)